jgi:hypothetical protein
MYCTVGGGGIPGVVVVGVDVCVGAAAATGSVAAGF